MDELTLRPLGIALVLGLSTGSVVFVRRQRMSALAEELGAEVAFPFGMSGPVPAAVSGGLSLFAAVLLSSGVMGFARFAILVACLFALSGTLRPVTEARAGGQWRESPEAIADASRTLDAFPFREAVLTFFVGWLLHQVGALEALFPLLVASWNRRADWRILRRSAFARMKSIHKRFHARSVWVRYVMPYESNSAPVSRATLRGEDVRLRLSPKRAVAGLRSIELAPAYFFGRFRARYDLRILLRVDETSHAARLAAARYPNALWRPSGTFGERILSIPDPVRLDDIEQTFTERRTRKKKDAILIEAERRTPVNHGTSKSPISKQRVEPATL